LDSPWVVVGIGAIVFGLVLIGVAVAIAVFLVDWQAIKERCAERKKLQGVHRGAEQGG
jgi:hypothetical protein